MKSISNTGARSLGQALLAIVFICGSQTILPAEGATYHQYNWSGGQPGFGGVLFLDSAYCRYDTASGLSDLIGPGSFVTTPGGGRYDLWQLQRDQKLQVRATFSSTQLRQLYIAQISCGPKESSEGLTLTQNYANAALAATAIQAVHDSGSSGIRLLVREQDASGSWIATSLLQAHRQAGVIASLK